MDIGNKTIRMQVDTRASCNFLPCRYMSTATEIRRTKRELVTYSKAKLSVLETAIEPARNPRNNGEYTVESVVVEDRFTPILEAEGSQKMDLVVVQRQNILHSSNVTSDVNQPTEEHDIHSLTEEEILSEYCSK